MQPDVIFLMLTFKIAHLNTLPLYQEPQHKKEKKKGYQALTYIMWKSLQNI